MTQLHLSWPARPLWANWRGHWRPKSQTIAKAREEARALALEAGIKRAGLIRPRLTFAFHPCTKALPDMQNMPHTQKAAIDGIADALGMDDKTFACVWPVEFSAPIKGGRVVVTITEHSPRDGYAELHRRIMPDAVGCGGEDAALPGHGERLE